MHLHQVSCYRLFMSNLKFYKRVKAPPEYPGKTYNNRNCLLHHLVWWQNTGELVPPGHVLHHKNEDKFDNRFENLELLSAAKHASHHRHVTAPTPPLVHLICPVCQTEFTRVPSQYRFKMTENPDRQLCCSRRCSVKRQWALGLTFKPKPLTHGTLTAYCNHGCRCDICKAHHSEWYKEYRRSKKENIKGGVA